MHIIRGGLRKVSVMFDRYSAPPTNPPPLPPTPLPPCKVKIPRQAVLFFYQVKSYKQDRSY